MKPSPSPFENIALMADPIHGYVSFTVQSPAQTTSEQTEQDLIDSPWIQRLRYILQLQSARWVYPGAEHTRFQHSIGTMHLAGRFMLRLYPSLKEIIPDLPSLYFMEELARLTALLHDIGHGPFCHFFDHHHLDQFGITHEQIGQRIIVEDLSSIIKNIRRSPSGPFASGESMDPSFLAFLILKNPQKSIKGLPRWLTFLQPLLGGIYTPDNCDYVLRDSYMCGVAIGPVDIERLLHYTFFTPNGLTIHQAGLPALQMFLNARLYLYTNVYFHRTTRAIDLHLQDIFRPTMSLLFSPNPLNALSQYLSLTDWHVLETVRTWTRSRSQVKRSLGSQWHQILIRHVRWKTAYSTLLELPHAETSFTPKAFHTLMRQRLPRTIRHLDFRVDFAHKDPRPLNLMNMGGFQIYVYNARNHVVEKESLDHYLDYLPARMITLRIFSDNHTHDTVLGKAAEETLQAHWPNLAHSP